MEVTPITADGWVIEKLSGEIGVETVADNDVLISNSTPEYWGLHKVISEIDLKNLLHVPVNLEGTFADMAGGYNLCLLAYNGATEWDNTQAIITNFANDNPIYADNWTEVQTAFIPEGGTSASLTFNLTNTYKNLAVMLRPAAAESPQTARIQSIKFGTVDPITTFEIITTPFA
ncbi:hypothetical protein TU18-21_00220 [Vibrio phage ICP3_2008_A]|uniref:Uncharacterized protein n=1 Tax=Vibrio phage ICP3_2008_A TaxID=979537 RepID=F1D0I7_9CAUD|nr:hypothetical protein TU18-21_00220 [Vibrio phage ICP3_2008_A]